MARTIEQIEASIIDKLKESNNQKKLKLNLNDSTSAAAEWKLWVNCFAYVIHMFEIILDSFKNEMNKTAEGMYAGSLTWYKEMCYRFQSGHTLVFDKKKMQPVYSEQDDSKKIIKTATVSIVDKTLVFKVATVSDKGAMVPLTLEQLEEFNSYLEMIKFAGTQTIVVSTDPDKIYYSINAYYDPLFPKTEVEKNIDISLKNFRTEQPFGGVIYRHKLLEAVTRVPGVVTARINTLTNQQQLPQLSLKNAIASASKPNIEYMPTFVSQFMEIETGAELYAGYFDYDNDCKLNLININQL